MFEDKQKKKKDPSGGTDVGAKNSSATEHKSQRQASFLGRFRFRDRDGDLGLTQQETAKPEVKDRDSVPQSNPNIGEKQTASDRISSRSQPEILKQTYQALWARELHQALVSENSVGFLNSLQSIPNSEMEGVVSAYQRVYQRSLVGSTQSLFKGKPEMNAQALWRLEGRSDYAQAHSLKTTLSAGDSEAGSVFTVVRDISVDERRKVAVAFDSLSEKPLVDSIKQLDAGSPLVARIAGAFFGEGEVEAISAQLAAHFLVAGESLESLDRQRVDPLLDRLRSLEDSQLENQLLNEALASLTQVEHSLGEEFQSLINGDQLSADVFRVNRILEKALTNPPQSSFEEILEIFRSYSDGSLKTLIDRYQEINGRAIEDDLRSAFANNESYYKDLSGLTGGLSSPDGIETVIRVLDGHRSYREALAVVAESSQDDLLALEQQIAKQRSKTLEELIKEKLRGEARFEMLLALDGAPLSLEEEHLLVNARHQYERGGYNTLSSLWMDRQSESGQQLDESVSRANRFYREVIDPQDLVKEDEETFLYALFELVHEDLEDYRKDRAVLASKGARTSSVSAAMISFFLVEGLDFWFDNLNQPMFLSVFMAAATGLLVEWLVEPYLQNRFMTADRLV